MKLLLPIFATLGLFAAACSGGETAIDVETEIEETTTTAVTVVPTSTTALVEDVATTTTIAPTTTAVAAEPVGDGEQVVTSPTTPTNTRGKTETGDTIILEGEEEVLQYQGYFAKAHSHDTAEGEIPHTHPYYTTAPSHFHRDGTIIYLDFYGDEFTNDDVSFDSGGAGTYRCEPDGCGKRTQPIEQGPITEDAWDCPIIPSIFVDGEWVPQNPNPEDNGCVRNN